MDCRSCGHGNRDSAAFCGRCGVALDADVACRSCGATNPSENAFCESCGHALAASTPPAYIPVDLAAKIRTEGPNLQGERRTVSVLFADAVGSTPIGERLDPEDVYGLMQGCVRHMLEAVHRYEGHVVQFRGDGIMALFGAPIAHEDAGRRAVAAALEMQEALTHYAEEVKSRGTPWDGIECKFRVGVNTGPVVVGGIGDDLHMDFTAIGDTVNLAARMESAAVPGTVYLTESTYRSVDDYIDCEPVGELILKGKAAPVAAYKAIAQKDVRTRFQASIARGLSPFVGRDRDLRLLQSLWQDALAGRGQIVLVSGAPGIGKSRLLLEFQQSLDPEVIWREAHCVSHGENIPYLPVVELVKSGFLINENDDAGSIIEKVDRDTSLWTPEAQKTAPYLKFLLQVDPGDDSVAQMDPGERRAGILDALRALILERARDAPRVVVVEDLHWADDQSEEAFRVCADVVAASPVLMILTFRPGYVHPSADLPHANRIVLGDLDPLARNELAVATLEAASLSTDLAATMTEKAEGNPLFIEELAKAISSGVTDVDTVPNRLQDVILARIDRLEKEARESLQLASVIGREFTVRLLDRISDLASELEGVLADLRTLELIYEKAFFPELAYMFKHALTHDVAYSTLLVERRKLLHGVVARAIEELYPERLSEHYETLARHYETAELWDKALLYLRRSGEKALAADAVQNAVAFYERALQVCDRLGDKVQKAEIAELRGIAYLSVFEIPEAIADFELMRTLSEAAGDAHLTSLAIADRSIADFFAHEFEASEDSATRALEIAGERYPDTTFAAKMALASTYIVTDRLDEGQQRLHEAMEHIGSSGQPLLVWLCGEFDVLRWNWKGRFDEAIAAIDIWMERLSSHGAVATAPTAWAGAVAHGGRGNYVEGLRLLSHAIEVCERTGAMPDILARALNTTGWIYGEIEDHDRALDWNDRGLTVAREIQSADPEFENNALLNLGDSALALGDLKEAEARYREVEAVVRDPRPHDRWMLWRYSQHLFASLGDLSLARGDAAGALRYAEECLTAATRSSSPKNVIKGARLRAQALAANGEREEASQAIEHALAVAREIGNPPQLWKTLCAGGDIAAESDRPEAKREAYRSAFDVINNVAQTLPDERRDKLLASDRVAAICREAD